MECAYTIAQRGSESEHTFSWQIFSREQLLILNSEDLFKEPHKVLSIVFTFLGLDENFEINDLRPRNVGSNRTMVESKVYEYLDDYFFPYNQALYQRLGQQFDW